VTVAAPSTWALCPVLSIVAVFCGGCVAAPNGAAAPSGRDIVIDGVSMNVRQVNGTALYGYVVDANGDERTGVVGTGNAVLVGGAPDRDKAIRAYGVFCSYDVSPADWDRDFVPQVPGTGDYQFEACL
jgi:hypothetical protein